MPEVKPWHLTQLLEPEFTRVDLVKEGANSQAHIKLFKNKEGGTPMLLEDILKKLTPEHAATVQKAVDEAIQKQADAEKRAKDAEDALAKIKEEGTPVPAGTTEEEILKTVKDPAVKALLETQIAKTKAAEEKVRKAHEAQVESEAIAKAKEVPNLGAEEATVISVYKKLKDVDPELCEEVFGIFKASSALVAEGGAFTEVGKSASSSADNVSENSAWDKIEKAADAIAKSANISQASAIAQVIKEQPALYDEYIKAQRG